MSTPSSENPGGIEQLFEALQSDMDTLRVNAAYASFDASATARERDYWKRKWQAAHRTNQQNSLRFMAMKADLRRLVDRKNSMFDEICALKDELRNRNKK